MAVTKAVRSMVDLREQFGMERSLSDDFLLEWQVDLPELTMAECATLDQVQQRFRYQREMGQVPEGAVNAIVVSRLLELAGFYDAPFRLRSEASVEISTRVEGLTLRGRIDFLVLQDQFWQAVVESKETEFDIEVGVPQILAYMMAAKQRQVFGMVTNGSHFLFIKLQREGTIVYDFSDTFSMLSRKNCLYNVLRILKKISQIIV